MDTVFFYRRKNANSYTNIVCCWIFSKPSFQQLQDAQGHVSHGDTTGTGIVLICHANDDKVNRQERQAHKCNDRERFRQRTTKNHKK